MQAEEWCDRLRVLFGGVFYSLAGVFAKLQKWSLAEKLYGLSEANGFRSYQSLSKRFDILGIEKKFWRQKAILEKSLDKKNIDVAKKLAGHYITLELYRDAIDILSEYEEDADILNITATALAKQNLIPEYTVVLEKLFITQKSVHRHNQLFFAYGRGGYQDKLVSLLREVLASEIFTDQQKDRFIRASIEGSLRSFFFNQVVVLYSSLNDTYSSSILAIQAAMAYECMDELDKALELYDKISNRDEDYAWWANLRKSGIYLKRQQHKKAYSHLSSLIGKPTASVQQDLPIVEAVNQAYMLSLEKRFEDAAKNLLSIFPGWDINIWNDNDDLIFTEYYHATKQLLERRVDIKRYLQSLETYSVRLAGKKLWLSADKALRLTQESFGRQGEPLAEKIYIQLARCLTNNDKTNESSEVISRGLSDYPQSFDLYVEKAQLYKKQLNVYKTREVWDDIFSRFDSSHFAPHIFTAAAESNLMSLNFTKHENILSLGESVHGTHDRTLAYYVWQSLCTKIINLNTESSITGGVEFSNTYNQGDLFAQLNIYSQIIIKYTYNEEMSHRIKHRAIQVYMINMVNKWYNPDIENSVIKPLEDLRLLIEPSIPDHLLNDLFRLITTSRSKHNSVLKQARNSIFSPSSILSANNWLIVHQLLIANKFLAIGYLARERAIASALQSSVSGYLSNHYDAQKKFHAALETTNIDLARQTLNQIYKCYPEQPVNDELAKLFSLQQPRSDIAIPEDPIYRSLIYKKSIAIAGPAPSESLQGYEIDTHDTVIRFNYRGRLDKSEWPTHGKITTVAYQNGPNVRAYFVSSIPSYMQELKVYNVEFILNDLVADDVNRQRARKNGLRIKLFNGVMMAVPAAVYDVLLFQPKKITLYGTNFYLSTRQYNKSYTIHKNGLNKYEDEKQNISRLLELISAHDLIAQKRFVKNLYGARKISVDKECLRVLNIPDDEYMRQMEDLYAY